MNLPPRSLPLIISTKSFLPLRISRLCLDPLECFCKSYSSKDLNRHCSAPHLIQAYRSQRLSPQLPHTTLTNNYRFCTSLSFEYSSMSGENSPPPTQASPNHHRRSSLASGQKLSELFGRSPPNANGSSNQPGPIATAAANASAQQRRRTSLAGLGLAGSPTSSSPFSQMRNRNSSVGSSNSPSSSIEESAIEDGDATSVPSPTSPFARRLSFGARALHDYKTGSNTANGRSAHHSLASAPSAKGRGLSSKRCPPNIFARVFLLTVSCHADGFNWSEQIRNRAERSASLTQRPPPPTSAVNPENHKSASVAVPVQPVKEVPKPPNKPDHFQERILKGDFYMD